MCAVPWHARKVMILETKFVARNILSHPSFHETLNNVFSPAMGTNEGEQHDEAPHPLMTTTGLGNTRLMFSQNAHGPQPIAYTTTAQKFAAIF